MPDTLAIFAVIVLYKTEPDESTAFRSLQAARSCVDQSDLTIDILLYDNTPDRNIEPSDLPEGVRYKAATRNVGVSGAYNYALAEASKGEFSWLLTLDQDTTLPESFLVSMVQRVLTLRGDATIAAIVPQLYDHRRLLSPIKMGGVKNACLPPGFVGISEGEIHAFNSGSLFRVEALHEMEGFSHHFWLDFLDAWVYKQLYRRAKRIFIAGDLLVEHALSLLGKTSVPPDRFSNILKAECAFTDLYESRLRGALLTARLVGRLYRQRKRGDDIVLRQMTRETLVVRLRQSRTQRIESWMREMERRTANSSNV
jgi:glycosyltransferase involved in cell wall biosynthesis